MFCQRRLVERPACGEIWQDSIHENIHVHLDATQLGTRLPNRSGTLFEGIDNWATLRSSVDAEDVRERALKTVGWYLRQGTSRIRTHVDTASRTAAEALIALRRSRARVLDARDDVVGHASTLRHGERAEQERARE